MKYGAANEIPPVEVFCPDDEFNNAIRKFGVVAACEWFGHEHDSKFTQETIDLLCKRSGVRP
jgi:hypothetical protein